MAESETTPPQAQNSKDTPKPDELSWGIWTILLDMGYLQWVVCYLLLHGIIDKERVSDITYLLITLRDNFQTAVDATPIVATLHNSFVETAKVALEEEDEEVAIVLLATAVEQLTNIFYRDSLPLMESFTEKEVTEIIRNTNFSMKIGSLFTLVMGKQFNEGLEKRALDLFDLRNQIVHYKAVPASTIDDLETGSYATITRRIGPLDKEDLLAIPDDFSEFFKQEFEVILRKKYANYDELAKLAGRIAIVLNRLFERVMEKEGVTKHQWSIKGDKLLADGVDFLEDYK